MPAQARGPAVLIIGGLLTSPPLYWAMRRRLLDRGAGRVAIAPVSAWRWLASAFEGLGPATSIVARAIDRLSDADGGRPILVIGHSGGGILARLALAPQPFDGAGRPRPGTVGAVVTIGTPHLAVRVDGTLGRQGLRALRFLVRYEGPKGPAGTWLTIGSTFLENEDPGGGWALRRLRRGLASACYVALLGARGRRVEGDGMVPLECTPLPAGEHLKLEGFAHGPVLWGGRWYGSDAGLDLWWASAMEAWRTAVAGGYPNSRGA